MDIFYVKENQFSIKQDAFVLFPRVILLKVHYAKITKHRVFIWLRTKDPEPDKATTLFSDDSNRIDSSLYQNINKIDSLNRTI